LNSPVLPMIDLPAESRTLRAGETRAIEVSVSNFGEEDIRDAVLSWRLLEGTRVVAGSEFTGSVECGRVERIGQIEVSPDSAAPQTLRLEVELHAGDHVYRNDWTLWAFPRLPVWPESGSPIAVDGRLMPLFRHWPFLAVQPPEKRSPQGLFVTPELTSAALDHLQAGGRVWCIRETEAAAKNAPSFFPASGGAQATRIAEHPAMGDFPHRGACDLQFYHLLERAMPLVLEGIAQKVAPIISVIRTTSSFLSKRKDLSYGAYLLEARVGAGRLLLSSLSLSEPLASGRPEAVHLCDRVLRYATGADFRPRTTLEPADLPALLGE
jgi:beta-galactosidase